MIPRYILDDALRNNAISVGAHILPGFTTRTAVHKQSRQNSIFGQLVKHQVKIKTDLVIMATGANRTFIQTAGVCNVRLPGALATRIYLTGLQNLDDFAQVFLDRCLLPGYGWIFPTGDQSANVGCGVVLNGRSTQEGCRQFRSAFTQLFQNASFIQALPSVKPQGYPIRSDFPDVLISAIGILVAGEAADLVDPINGEGTALALRSGWLAARVASYALSVGDFTDRLLKVYDDALHQMFEDYFIEARQFLSW